MLKRLIVVGAGAVGGSIGGLLKDAQLPVILIARGEHGRAIRSDGLEVHTPRRVFGVKPECVEQPSEVDWQDGDVVMLSTKLQDAQAAMDDVLTVAGSDVPIVCATNGVHGERWAMERFSSVISMLVWLPATYLDPGEVRLHSGECPGVLDNGPVRGQRASEVSISLCSWLQQVGFDAVSRDDMQRWKYAKWITNLGGAAQAMITDDWLSVAKMAQAEGEAILSAAKVSRVTVDELLERAKAVCQEPIGGETRQGGSTWQSYRRGKPMESRWLEGAMADLADEIGVPAPINRLLSDASLSPRPLLASEIVGEQP